MSSERSFPIADETTVYDPSFLRREFGEAARPGQRPGAEVVDESELIEDATSDAAPADDAPDDEGEGPATEREPAPAAALSPGVSSEAYLDSSVELGPFVVVGPGVE